MYPFGSIPIMIYPFGDISGSAPPANSFLLLDNSNLLLLDNTDFLLLGT